MEQQKQTASSSQIYIPDAELERLIVEDIPYLDLTTEILGIGDSPGTITLFTREDCVLCATEEAARIMGMLGLTVDMIRPTGTRLAAGESLLSASGDARALHRAWKVSLNLVDRLSGIATKTDRMVRAARSVSPGIPILTTRKSMPGVKSFMTEAVMAGGADPHRLGLSETVLVFDNHISFLGGLDGFIAELPRIKRSLCEKKVFVEAGAQDARRLVAAGVDGIQFDKLSCEELAAIVPELRAIEPHVTLIAAGGINLENVVEYASTGVDGIVTSCLFTARPIDMGTRLSPVR